MSPDLPGGRPCMRIPVGTVDLAAETTGDRDDPPALRVRYVKSGLRHGYAGFALSTPS